MALESDLQGGWDLMLSKLACYCQPLQNYLPYIFKKLSSHLSLFSKEKGQMLVPPGSEPAKAKAQQKLQSWRSQVELAEEIKKGLDLSHSSVTNSSELLDQLSLLSLSFICASDTKNILLRVI